MALSLRFSDCYKRSYRYRQRRQCGIQSSPVLDLAIAKLPDVRERVRVEFVETEVHGLVKRHEPGLCAARLQIGSYGAVSSSKRAERDCRGLKALLRYFLRAAKQSNRANREDGHLRVGSCEVCAPRFFSCFVSPTLRRAGLLKIGMRDCR